MSRNSKRVGWHGSPPAHHNHCDYLVQSLGTPDGLRALSELVSDVVFASAVLVLILSKNTFGDTFLRVAAALALRRALFRVGGRGRKEV
jgi:hypothetical protein